MYKPRNIAAFITVCLIVALIINFSLISAKTNIIGLSDKQFYTELIAIKGIGPTLAEKIIDYRKANPYAAPADFVAVEGIGEKKTKLIKKRFK